MGVINSSEQIVELTLDRIEGQLHETGLNNGLGLKPEGMLPVRDSPRGRSIAARGDRSRSANPWWQRGKAEPKLQEINRIWPGRGAVAAAIFEPRPALDRLSGTDGSPGAFVALGAAHEVPGALRMSPAAAAPAGVTSMA
jgi:hypothetical protein